MKKKVFYSSVACTAILLGATNCERDREQMQTDFLVGDWKVRSLDGDFSDFDEYLEDSDYEIVVEFKSNGDIHFEMIEDEEYLYGVVGEWRWDNSDFTEIEVRFRGDVDLDILFEIDYLDGDIMIGELNADYDSEKYRGEIELEKIR